jgi:hypothetical protein
LFEQLANRLSDSFLWLDFLITMPSRNPGGFLAGMEPWGQPPVYTLKVMFPAGITVGIVVRQGSTSRSEEDIVEGAGQDEATGGRQWVTHGDVRVEDVA